MTTRIRNASGALLFLGCLVTLTSAFNLPNRSSDLSSRLASLSTVAKSAQQRTVLTLADRVAYQRAIEEVYWRHRIWPRNRGERPDPKPSIDEAMSRAQLEKKVEEYLRTSQALEDYWQRPITPDQLQTEMDRMARHTKQPEVLREIFAALDDDPFVIAECLARPVLSQRLGRSLQAVQLKIALSRSNLTAPSANYRLPKISDGANGCTDDTWTPTSLVNAPDPRANHTAVWTGSEMIVWGGNSGGSYFSTGGRYNPATDSWTATSTTSAPIGRDLHTAVWTGSEMIVWGGHNSIAVLNTGGRYNPGTDTWTATSTTNAPTARDYHTAVWTGVEMIVWGGFNGGTALYTGGRYNPGTDSWVATNTTSNVPTARTGHTAVWTGSEMIVWGGVGGGSYLNSGGRYNPSTDSWATTSTSNAANSRAFHTAVWTGSEMIVWGGYNAGDGYLNNGGRYNPGTDSWADYVGNAPSARDSHTAVWNGSEMIVWGGYGNSGLWNSGGRYDPSADSWVATSTINAPIARYNHTAVWTGSEMIVWGGTANAGPSNTGGKYCALVPQSAFSRKTHGTAGIFDIPLLSAGAVECRSGGPENDYQMIINFVNPVTVETVSVTSGTGTVSSFTVNGLQVMVNLTGVTNVQRITVTLFNVNQGTHNVPVSMGVLVGDVNGSATVNASDVSLTKAQVGQPVTSSNFREDVNANGSISVADVALVKANVGTALPPPPDTLWYNGDFNGVNGLANERDTIVTQAAVYDDFNVPAGQMWNVTGVFSRNLENTVVTAADWEIRTGVSEGNAGTLVASGTTNSPGVTEISCGFSFCEYRVDIAGLNVTLVPGHYWLNVTPVGNGTGRSFNSTTSGANCVGTPCGNNQNAFFNSTYFGTYFTSTANEGQPTDFSNGVIGIALPEPRSGR